MGPRLISTARTLLFPPKCVGCGELLPPFGGGDTVFCPLCRTKWEAALAEAASKSAEDAARGLVYLTFYRPGRGGGIPERVIYHIKHRGDPRVFSFLAARLAPRVMRTVRTIPSVAPLTAESDGLPPLVTYPPRRGSAVRAEGFDQAARLARSLSRACGWTFVRLIRRTRASHGEQKALDAQGRAENATRSYALTANAAARVRGRRVVICDDLRTTGATLGRCAELLVEAGAVSVVLVTVAETAGRDGDTSDE